VSADVRLEEKMLKQMRQLLGFGERMEAIPDTLQVFILLLVTMGTIGVFQSFVNLIGTGQRFAEGIANYNRGQGFLTLALCLGALSSGIALFRKWRRSRFLTMAFLIAALTTGRVDMKYSSFIETLRAANFVIWIGGLTYLLYFHRTTVADPDNK